MAHENRVGSTQMQSQSVWRAATGIEGMMEKFHYFLYWSKGNATMAV